MQNKNAPPAVVIASDIASNSPSGKLQLISQLSAWSTPRKSYRVSTDGVQLHNY